MGNAETIQTKFQIEKMYILPDAGNLKAFFDFSINEVVVVKGARIIGGKKGLFISMPQEQGKDNKWYDQVVFKSAAPYEEISTLAFEYYKQNGGK